MVDGSNTTKEAINALRNQQIRKELDNLLNDGDFEGFNHLKDEITQITFIVAANNSRNADTQKVEAAQVESLKLIYNFFCKLEKIIEA